jgi:hypothetical protein
MAQPWSHPRRWLLLLICAIAWADPGSAQVAVKPAPKPKPPPEMLAPYPPIASKTPRDVYDDHYGTYLRLLEGYRRYDEAQIKQLGEFWESMEYNDHVAIGVLVRMAPVEIGPLSQMALTDLALAAFGARRLGVGTNHLTIAEQWIIIDLEKIPHGEAAYERQRRFARNWYLAMIWYRMARAELGEVSVLLEHARARFPDDPDVLLASGSFEEFAFIQLRREHPDWLPKVNTSLRHEGLLDNSMSAIRATGYYRDAIRLDSKAAEARIRLAYLLHSMDSSHHDEEMTLLKEARTLEPKPPLSYLAALFAGLIEERVSHLDAAAGWYRSAVADCPRAQTARLGLSHIQLDQSHQQSAQNSLRPLFGGPPPRDNVCEPDPWREYDFGQTWRLADQIILMRKDVREPAEGSRP